ncbi:hypothetical protein H7169_00985 [Candidatus Gracilibacteria bacterium]|nr:hypothetical protein [Candidatus Gracilibacteria bacterium]
MRILPTFLFLFFILFSIFLYQGASAKCTPISNSTTPVSFLQGCAGSADNAISPIGTIGGGVTAVKSQVIDISKKIIAFGALFAIGALVFSGIQYTTTYGDDEKIKKAKTTGISAVIGLLLLLVAFPLVDIFVNFIYGLGT